MASVRDLKVRQLTKLAKEQGLKGYSKKNLNCYGYWKHKKTL